jgi:hypothetical protein
MDGRWWWSIFIYIAFDVRKVETVVFYRIVAINKAWREVLKKVEIKLFLIAKNCPYNHLIAKCTLLNKSWNGKEINSYKI